MGKMVVSRRQVGFTLIEAMIVVIIIGITATLAVVGYRKWVQTSHLSEATDMVSHIRSAEEAFRAENGVTYLPVSISIGPGYDYPCLLYTSHPGARRCPLGGPTRPVSAPENEGTLRWRAGSTSAIAACRGQT